MPLLRIKKRYRSRWTMSDPEVTALSSLGLQGCLKVAGALTAQYFHTEGWSSCTAAPEDSLQFPVLRSLDT